MKKTRRYMAALSMLAAVVMGGTTACSSIISPGSGSDSLTVYSNSLSDGRSEWLQEKAKEAGFTLQLVELGGGDVYNRLAAEKNTPLADVTFGLNDIYFQKLIADDALEAYTPSWASELDPSIVDSSGAYYPIVREPIMLVCNDAAYSAPADAPQDWTDLWEKPQFHQRYEVPSALGGGTTQMVIAGILSRYTDPQGKLGVSQAGWDAVAGWYTNGVRAEQGTDLYAQMKNGRVDCGQMWQAGKVTREAQYDISTSAAHPAIGVPFVRQGVALVKGSKHQETAKKFIDWFGSAEVQSEWSKEFSTVPTNSKALANGNKDAIDFADSFTEQDIDWKFVTDNLEGWVEEIQLNYVK